MHVLLPPSETKRSGGSTPFVLEELAFPELTERRGLLRDALVELSRDREASARALKLGPRQLEEIDRNAALTAPVGMAAVDRFDGVLFDALDAGSLDAEAREALGRTVLIQSALWGPVGALDEIPAYRLSHDSRIPGFPLKRWWSQPAAAVLAGLGGLVLDLRSEAYAALGPLVAGEDRRFVRVRSRDASGTLRNLNHFNKQGKGRFVRALVEDGVQTDSLGELADWARGRGFELAPNRESGELDLVVREG
ncbi:peroxide stress protein YaaA [Rathayibacter sp. VKM Ac-2803]|uniref:YaaA family protein n=1 Tax=unclassified Rathayibacter TaxID=2609250 RepID=UPI00135AF99E|nr:MULTISPECIES: peroxide stress protein YaaA [unclassified Rathayibacter]MWV50393.1 peroxide stress protein YaaA [Rathayibacter sp. VKM Ac-2803]MWV60610.1 peroxide stress protein YaaA [Rathayibacter sp. VKM Ac-2754]